MNIDPFEEYAEVLIWDALEQENLKEFVCGLDKKLLFECAEGGENLRYECVCVRMKYVSIYCNFKCWSTTINLLGSCNFKKN